MKVIFISPRHRTDCCQPITCTRSLTEVPIANRTLAELQLERSRTMAATTNSVKMVVYIYNDCWLSPASIPALAGGRVPAALEDKNTGETMAWIQPKKTPAPAAPPDSVLRLKADNDSFLIRYPWDLLRVNEIIVGDLTESKIAGAVSPASQLDGQVEIGVNTRILPGVYIEGNAIIGADCKIGPNCYIRGNTTIGDGCHIGQAVEVKNSLIMRHTSLGHLSYCGDSILGEKVNFGAGTITANLRHDGCNQKSMIAGKLIDTGRRKLGTVAGDGVHTGIHTSIYPGRKMWPNTMTRPGAVVDKDITG